MNLNKKILRKDEKILVKKYEYIVLGDELATPQKPVTLQLQVTVWPQVCDLETVPIPVEPVTVTLWSYPYLCYTLPVVVVSIHRFIFGSSIDLIYNLVSLKKQRNEQ